MNAERAQYEFEMAVHSALEAGCDPEDLWSAFDLILADHEDMLEIEKEEAANDE